MFILTTRKSFVVEKMQGLAPKDVFGKLEYQKMYSIYLQPFNSQQRDMYITSFIQHHQYWTDEDSESFNKLVNSSADFRALSEQPLTVYDAIKCEISKQPSCSSYFSNFITF